MKTEQNIYFSDIQIFSFYLKTIYFPCNLRKCILLYYNFFIDQLTPNITNNVLKDFFILKSNIAKHILHFIAMKS